MPQDDARIPESDLYLFNHGELLRAWKHLGAHPVEGGVRFAVWAPYAEEVGVAGDRTGWEGGGHRLEQRGSTGVWEGVFPDFAPGDLYKYDIRGADGKWRKKADPFGFRMELRPSTASLVWPLGGFSWSDDEWLSRRAERQAVDAPMRIYEVHVGGWRRGRSYRDLATELVEYVAEMGFTHVEFLPLAEHPYDPSWGYQVCGYYAATSRFGSPQDLMYLVNALHQRGIGVIIDWVPAHFPKDEHGLYRFDGTHLFEHEDPRRGVHKDWDTMIFNYARPEVSNFLWSNALFWLEEFHVDGLRVDAVASMIYRDYSREEGQWVPNQYGGREDLEAIEFLRRLNDLVHSEVPGAITIAEESTAFPGVTVGTHLGGLGFDWKWNMGWMHDSLDYFRRDPVYRKHHQDRLTFALYYAFHERFLLPLSHDEVVHLKKSLLDKMPGDEWRKHANLRLLHAWQAAHPGKSLLFMGGEFGEWREFSEARELDWALLGVDRHRGQAELVRELNGLVRAEPCLHCLDHDWAGFEWIDFSDFAQSVISFLRLDRDGNGMVWVLNFTPVARYGYHVGVPRAGHYAEILNTDATDYGGSGVGNLGGVQSTDEARHERPHSIALTLPPLAAIAFRLPAHDGTAAPSPPRRRDRPAPPEPPPQDDAPVGPGPEEPAARRTPRRRARKRKS